MELWDYLLIAWVVIDSIYILIDLKYRRRELEELKKQTRALEGKKNE